MVAKAEKLKTEKIEKILSMVADRLDKKIAADVQIFVRHYYDRLSPEDILEVSEEHLYGSALSLYKFSEKRPPGTAKLRAFTPNLEEHGWKTSHSVIEITNDDMPFLVDSITSTLSRRGLTVHLVIHPVLFVERDEKGKRNRILDKPPTARQKGQRESIMHFEIDEQSDPKALADIEHELKNTLADVRLAVEDWKPILGKVDHIIKSLTDNPPPLVKEEVDEARALLKWMSDNHFTFLGYREFEFGEAAKVKKTAGISSRVPVWEFYAIQPAEL